jgi:putative PIN family toxin of toxin-antitoxin system
MSKRNKIRIVIDVNLWIRYLIAKDIKVRFDAVLSDIRFQILNCNELLEEILDVARRPRIKKYISDDVLKRFKKTFPNTAEYIVLKSKVKLSPDPDDNYLLELSKDGKADFFDKQRQTSPFRPEKVRENKNCQFS